MINNLKAQDSDFVGTWQLHVADFDTRDAIFTKVFNANGEFYNSRSYQGKTHTTHKGKYIIDDKEHYTELIEESDREIYPKNLPVPKIEYEFSKDKKLLSLRVILTGADGKKYTYWAEVWKRVEIDV
ncbi:MAG: DUF4488 domain-containing protein [Pedobacter sp.]